MDTEDQTERDLVATPGVRTILSPELSAALLRHGMRDRYAAAAGNRHMEHGVRASFASQVDAIEADIDNWRRMRQVCALQDALPSGGVLCYSDGSLARIATVDLRTPGTR